MIEILLIVIAMALIYNLGVKPYTYWAKKNVRTGKVMSFLADDLLMTFGRETLPDMIQKIYNKLPDVRYLGHYQLQAPILVLKSPEIIKQICVKDFDHFLNRKLMLPDGIDELWSKSLFSLKDQKWKNMRSTLSPCFTSSKMKSMFFLICRNANLFAQYFMETNEKIIEIECRDAFGRYTSDVIGSTAFGIHVDSLKDKENQFFKMGIQAGKLISSVWTKMTLHLYQACPAIANFFRMKIVDVNVKSFFLNLVKDTIKIREEQNIKRPDMLGLLMEAKNGQNNEELSKDTKEDSFALVEEHLKMKIIKQSLTNTDIASQAFAFFLGGFDTVSTAMCFMAYELALNSDVQQKLIEEIDENGHQNSTPSYELIADMTYLDMVVSETLRKWPIAATIDRVVTKPYIIEAELPGESAVHLDIGDILMVPIYAIHHDPKVYENPGKFNPERFSPENRKNINPYTYLPFGVGPRNCIGSRFALLELKAVFFHLLRYFEIVPVEKTEIPPKMCSASLNLTPRNGFFLGLKRRT